MRTTVPALVVAVPVLVGLVAVTYSQEPNVDRVTVPFSDPSRPRSVRVNLLDGGITVKGYDGKDVIVEARPRASDSRRRSRREENAEGLRRLENPSTGLSVEEQDNVVTIGNRAMNRTVELQIQVPVATSLKLHTVNGGNIAVDHVSGEIDVENVNGAVTLNNVSGVVVAHALNGNVVVTFDKVTPDKSMSFSSLNGNIDVTLPPDVKAKLKMKSENGDIFTDFDIQMDASSRQPTVEETRSKNGKYRVQFDKALYGQINGGGPEMQFTTLNGRIYIRKKK